MRRSYLPCSCFRVAMMTGLEVKRKHETPASYRCPAKAARFEDLRRSVVRLVLKNPRATPGKPKQAEGEETQRTGCGY